MKRLPLAFLIALSATTALSAQPTPFDMTPERSELAPDSSLPPEDLGIETPAPQPGDVQSAEFRRPLLPTGDIMLQGEIASRSWALHLTNAQASAPMRLHLGYSNAIVVAPEVSRLQLLINDSVVIETPIRSADGVGVIEVDVPAGLLRAGRNEVSLRVSQRHRTDCTIDSTYELWTSVNAAQTYLVSDDLSLSRLSAVEDLRAIAPDTSGRATIAIVAPGMSRNDIGADILKLAQTIALYQPLPDLNYVIDAAPSDEQENASLRVFIGERDELEALGVDLPAGATGPIATFAEQPDGIPTFIVSGQTRGEWLEALDGMLAPLDRSAGTRREAVTTEAWRLPNAPMIYGARELTFSELGVRSESFSGRNFSTSFQFSVPSDFYAGSYGEAQILLDAAYAQGVLPGSLINVYVNDSIAISMPLNDDRGAVLEKLPLRMTMRHFKPGLNEIRVVATLRTAEDEACAAAGLTGDQPRFAIFNSSRFVVPAFARIGQSPNLAALSGTGYPYSQAEQPVPVVTERNDAPTLSVAADLLARMALSAGRAMPVTLTTSIDTLRDRNAIFIGSINTIPSPVLSQVNVSEEARSHWVASHGGVPLATDAAQADPQAWREQMGARNWFRDIEEWFDRTFELNLSDLRFVPSSEPPFVPSRPAQVMVAQGINPAGNGVWTLVSAPDTQMLQEGVSAISRLPNWTRLSGRLANLDNDEETISALPATTQKFVETQPVSINNFRLIVANWLSSNILSYSLVLVATCFLVGIATSALLSRSGRRH